MSAVVAGPAGLPRERGERGRYWQEARHPWPTLLFVLPFILAYETGVAWLQSDPQPVRNGADFWMRSWMLDVGLMSTWALPAILIGVLLAWQVMGRYSWRCSMDTLTGMFGESLLFALLLVICGQSLNILFRDIGLPTLGVESAGTTGSPSTIARAVSFLGAGIYEEMMFRLALIPVGFYLLRMLLLPRKLSLVLAVTFSSLIFAAAHYLPPTAGISSSSLLAAFQSVAGDPGLWYGFSFRLLAGVAFSLLLLLRGFGITVGCHALYDLMAGVLMQPYPE